MLTGPLCACSDLAKQYEKKLEQLKREEELIREEGQEAQEAAQPEGHSLPARDSAPELAAAAAATAVMREAAATAVVESLQVRLGARQKCWKNHCGAGAAGRDYDVGMNAHERRVLVVFSSL